MTELQGADRELAEYLDCISFGGEAVPEAAELRETRYAREVQTVVLGDLRLERIFVKHENQEEIRLGWWPDGHLAPRPVDVPEETFIKIVAAGIREGVLSPRFLARLIVEVGKD